MAVTITNGPGSPEGVRTADVASLFQQSDGVKGRTLWRKRLGTGNTGWGLMQADLGWHNVQDYNAKGDGTTNDQTAIQNAITAAAASGGVVYFPRTASYYKVAGTLNVASPIILMGAGAEIRQANANTKLFNVTSSNVQLHRLQLVGFQFATRSDNEVAIDLAGPSAASPLSGLTISQCRFSSWGGSAVRGKFANEISVLDNIIDSCSYAGVLLTSCQRGVVRGNYINNITGASGAAYGITLTRAVSSSLATDPRSSDFTVTDNVLRNVLNWEGIDTHGGQRITIAGNTVLGCKQGVNVGPAEDPSGPFFAPLDVLVAHNVVDSNRTDGGADHGIVFAGADPGQGLTLREKARGGVISNIIRGHGAQSGDGAGLLLRTTQSVTVSGNTIVNCSPYGVLIWYNNYDTTLAGNTITNSWSSTAGHNDASGVKVWSEPNSVHIASNHINKEPDAISPAPTYNTVNALLVLNLSNISVYLGDNGYDAAISNPVSDPGNRISTIVDYKPVLVVGALTSTGAISPQQTAAKIYSGTGSPEGVVTASPGSLYLNTSGGLNTGLYVKETGTGAIGWKAK